MSETVTPGEPPIVAGDVVELKSGSFPMTVERINPTADEDGFTAFLVWDINGEYGRAARLQKACLSLGSLKRYVRLDLGDELPF